MLYSIFLICCGASLGALLRWQLGVQLNPLFVNIPLGTLIANLVGGYLIGLSVGAFSSFQSVPQEVRLLGVVGFLGGLTTFSGFSAEVVVLIQREQLSWALGLVSLHVIGSLIMTFLGIFTIQFLRGV
ncbi:MAG: fluoride efflux transporter CrcB [Methylophilaceae bacterium]|jgi:CrcB protein|nr:fluoride efflux transporter CrcB [Methyloradius sp.]